MGKRAKGMTARKIEVFAKWVIEDKKDLLETNRNTEYRPREYNLFIESIVHGAKRAASGVRYC